MEKIEKPTFVELEGPPPFPGTKDLVIIDGKFAQCVSADEHRATFVFIEERDKFIFIEPDEWAKYEYTKPVSDEIDAGSLVEKGLMSRDQLENVQWGSEDKKNPELKEVVNFFGTFTKKK